MAMGSCGSGALLTSLPHSLSLSLVWVPSLWGVPSFWTGDFLQFSLLDQSSQTVRPLTVRYRLYCALAARLSGRGPVAMVPYFPLLPPLPQGLSRVLLLWYLHFKTQTSAPFSNLWSFAGGSEVQPSLPLNGAFLWRALLPLQPRLLPTTVPSFSSASTLGHPPFSGGAASQVRCTLPRLGLLFPWCLASNSFRTARLSPSLGVSTAPLGQAS